MNTIQNTLLLTSLGLLLALSPAASGQHFDDMAPGTDIQDDECYNPPGGSSNSLSAIPGESYTGRWKTTYGIMNFYESNGQVTGQHEDGSGGFQGTRQGDFVRGRFSDSSGAGPMIFVLRRNGICFNGGYVWDNGDSRGQWNGHRVPADH